MQFFFSLLFFWFVTKWLANNQQENIKFQYCFFFLIQSHFLFMPIELGSWQSGFVYHFHRLLLFLKIHLLIISLSCQRACVCVPNDQRFLHFKNSNEIKYWNSIYTQQILVHSIQPDNPKCSYELFYQVILSNKSQNHFVMTLKKKDREKTAPKKITLRNQNARQKKTHQPEKETFCLALWFDGFFVLAITLWFHIHM